MSDYPTVTSMLSDDQIKIVHDCAEKRLPLPKSFVYHLGEFGRSGKFELHPAARTESWKNVRAPSRTYPFTVYRHALTIVYARQLSKILKKEGK